MSLPAETATPHYPEQPLAAKRVALVHEWLSDRAGSEVLFEQMAATFPEADLFALTRNPAVPFDFTNRPLRTTWLDRWETIRERRSLTLPVMPLAWKSVKRADYDVIISSTHAFGREFVRPDDHLHLNYVHAPMRYAWTPELDARVSNRGAGGWLAMRALRAIDRRTIDRVDSFAANSTAVAERIEKFYGRQAEVIHPPVDTDYFSQIEARDDGYLLSASRFIPYKRHDLAIEAAAHLGMPLIVAGSGPEESRLRVLADAVHPGGVEFVIQPERERLRDLMAGASAFVFSANEDFGIIVPEVQAAGTPVVALRAGGTLDTVADRKSGVLAEAQTLEALTEAIRDCLMLNITADECRHKAAEFSVEAFRRNLQTWVKASV